MIGKEILKEIIVSNEEFILNQIRKILKRERISFPEKLNKVVILYGVRRSGKSYVLFNLFKKYKDCALYMDFEDERLSGFEVKDFESLKDAFLELKPHLLDRELVFLFDEIQPENCRAGKYKSICEWFLIKNNANGNPDFFKRKSLEHRGHPFCL